MSKNKIVWNWILEPNIHGKRAVINGTLYDIVRFYANDWRVNYTGKSFKSFSEAKKSIPV